MNIVYMMSANYTSTTTNTQQLTSANVNQHNSQDIFTLINSTNRLNPSVTSNTVSDHGTTVYSRDSISPSPAQGSDIYTNSADEEFYRLRDQMQEDLDDVLVPEDGADSSESHSDAESCHNPTYNYDDVRIVQWNTQGLGTSLATMWNDLQSGNVSALLIQEQHIPYNSAWTPISIPGYHRDQDPLHKTILATTRASRTDAMVAVHCRVH